MSLHRPQQFAIPPQRTGDGPPGEPDDSLVVSGTFDGASYTVLVDPAQPPTPDSGLVVDAFPAAVLDLLADHVGETVVLPATGAEAVVSLETASGIVTGLLALTDVTDFTGTLHTVS